MNIIQGGVFQQDNTRPHNAVAMQYALPSVDMLPRSKRLPDLSRMGHHWTTTPTSSTAMYMEHFYSASAGTYGARKFSTHRGRTTDFGYVA
ncbi:hypothetical protein TNCV_2615991 [Trichonephila clavipes]|nr:hypothetical protein TNCV_2615991 [Trichonephila clavipes]